MDTSLYDFLRASQERPGAIVPSGHGVGSRDDVISDPPIVKSANLGTGEDEGNAEKRVDAAVPSQENAGMLDDRFGGTDFTSFATWLQIASNLDVISYRPCGVIDIIQDRNTEIRKAASQRLGEGEASLIENHQSQIATLVDQHQRQAALSEAKIEELTSSLQGAQAALKSTTIKLAIAESSMKLLEDIIQVFLDELSNEKPISSDLTFSEELIVRLMKSKEILNEAFLDVKDGEVQRLRSIIQEKDNALGDLQSAKDQLSSMNQKLWGQLSAIEGISVRELVTRGSFSEARANPDLLVSAAQSVDRAMNSLARFLYENSFMRGTSSKAPALASFLRSLIRTGPEDFRIPADARTIWGHRICIGMFKGFEHVYFDVAADRTSPSHSEIHASNCFRTYQQKKDVSSLGYFKECVFFREYCTKKFSHLFPARLIADARLEDSVKPRKNFGGFGGSWEEPAHVKRLFLDVAKAIWLLHELAFSFHPPANILRIPWEEPFDDEYQEAVNKDDDNLKLPLQVLLMLRPGFRVKNSVIKSRVFLSKRI